MNKEFNLTISKSDVFVEVASYISSFVRIYSKDDSRPWGGFFVIEEADAEKFIAQFFPHITKEALAISGKLSPKILLVEPGKKLSGSTTIDVLKFGN